MHYLVIAFLVVCALIWIRSNMKKRRRTHIELPDDLNDQWVDFVRDYFKDGRQR